MDSRSGELELIFAEALELPKGPERERYVAARCGDDGNLLSEVTSLLQAHDAAGDFLLPRSVSEPIRAPDSGAHAPLPKFRGFRIENRLGTGSIGTVYAAFDEKLG